VADGARRFSFARVAALTERASFLSMRGTRHISRIGRPLMFKRAPRYRAFSRTQRRAALAVLLVLAALAWANPANLFRAVSSPTPSHADPPPAADPPAARPLSAKLRLSFPAAVAPEALAAAFVAKNDRGDLVSVAIESSKDDPKTLFASLAEWPATARVAPGLKSRDGSWELRRELTFSDAEGDFLVIPSVVANDAWTRVAMPAPFFGGATIEKVSAKEQIVALEFARPVEAVALRAALGARDGEGVDRPFELATEGASSRHRVRFALANPLAAKLSMAIAPGLADADGRLLEEAASAEVEWSTPPLEVDSAYVDHYNGKDGVVLHARFNRTIDPDAAAKHLRFEPPVANLRVARGYWGEWLEIRGDFAARQSYRLGVDDGLLDADGLPALAASNPLRFFDVQDVPSWIGFGGEGKFYFPKQGRRELTILSRNASGASVRASRVFPSNVAAMLGDLDEGTGGRRFGERWSEPLGSRALALAGQPDRLVETRVPLDDLLAGATARKGLFFLEAMEGGVVRDTKLALSTELGMLAQWSSDEAWVFVHDLRSLEPVEGAAIALHSTKNQPLGTASTDENGVARFAGLPVAALGAPAVAVAELGDDYSFLELKPERGDAAIVGAGTPFRDNGAPDAFLFADRELYRPGETVHLRWIVRADHGATPTPELPVLFEAIKPNGQALASEVVQLSELGTGGRDIDTMRDYPTGRYLARLSIPGGRALGEFAFHVEDFAPQRVEAEIAINEAGAWRAGEARSFTLAARHLFGAPAADRMASVALQPGKIDYRSAAWPGFRFGNDDPFEARAIPLGESATDEIGEARFAVNAARLPVGATSPLSLVALGEVFELGGRSVRASARATYFPADVALGLALSAGAAREELLVDVAAIGPDDAPAAIASVEATLLRAEWRYNARRYHSHDEPIWTRDYVVAERQAVALAGGRGAARFSLEHARGDWRVEVRSDETPMKASLDFETWSGQPAVSSGARSTLARLEIAGDGRRAGDEIEIVVRCPTEGRAIVALQGERLHDVATTEIRDGAGSVRFRLAPEHFPNVWAQATVIHEPFGAAAGAHPYSSFAAANIALDDPARRLDVAFPDLPEEIAPGESFAVEIEVRDGFGASAAGAEITLAAVDEGIHAVTGFAAGDPAAWLGRDRQPRQNRAHYYDRVALDFGAPAVGGDGGGEDALAARLDAGGETWLRPVALWSGVVSTDELGRARVAIEPPAGYNGRLRLVATAASKGATGSASAPLHVREPLMFRSNQPRFLLPDDIFESRASFFNQTDEPTRVRASWSADGALRTEGGAREIVVAPRGEASFLARFEATDQVGQGDARWVVETLGDAGEALKRVERRVPIPVRAPAAWRSHREVAIVAPGETRAFSNAMFLPGARASAALSAGASPALGLERALADLADYPYGCVEQTSSRLLPLVALSSVAGAVRDNSDPRLAPERLDHYIDSGVARLFSMQTPSGGLAYWPGGREAHPFGSVYALHCLALAESTGRALPAENMAALIRYARGVAKVTSSEPESAFAQAYAIYALGLAGERGQLLEIDRLDRPDLPDPARCLLAAAMAREAPDAARASAFLASRPVVRLAPNPSGAVFSSDIRDAAIRLSTLCALGASAKPEAKRELAERLSRWLSNERGNTHENALVVTALADYLKDAPPSGECAWTLLGADGSSESFATPEAVSRDWRGGVDVAVRNDGAAPLYVSFEASGVPAKPDERAEELGLSVSRRFLDRQGVERDGAAFAAGESAIVELRIVCRDAVDHLAVEEPFAAGFEVEHPRLDVSTANAVGLADPVEPTRLEVRDDRLVLAFERLPAGEHVFHYVAQASTPGTFRLPAIAGECMYDASVRGRSAPGVVEIR
jgi:uncharacterized protein YfaS (alpha-2-macroglobulin family)